MFVGSYNESLHRKYSSYFNGNCKGLTEITVYSQMCSLCFLLLFGHPCLVYCEIFFGHEYLTEIDVRHVLREGRVDERRQVRIGFRWFRIQGRLNLVEVS